MLIDNINMNISKFPGAESASKILSETAIPAAEKASDIIVGTASDFYNFLIKNNGRFHNGRKVGF